MRITNNMMISNMIKNLGNNQGRLSKYQDQLDTGKKISVPSDDPVVAARALKLRTDVAKVEQYQKNIKDAQSWLDATDEAMSKVGDVLQKARELTVQASNGTNTPAETQKIALELKQLKAQAVHLANSTYAGRYIFSGFNTDQKLISDETSPNYGRFAIKVDTDKEKIFYEIGVGDSININVAGGDLFNNGGDADNPTNGISTSRIDKLPFPYTIGANNTIGVDVDGTTVTAIIPSIAYPDAASLGTAIETAVNAVLPGSVKVTMTNGQIELRTTSKLPASYIKLTATPNNFLQSVNVTNTVETTGADGETPSMFKMFDDVIYNMDAGNYQEISNQLDVFDREMNNVLRSRADVGARTNRVDLTEDRMGNDLINFTKLMSENEDVDVAETIMNLKNEENVYQASLAGGARIIQQTLVDFLR
jgi:flagellar hook-associated protein 3